MYTSWATGAPRTYESREQCLPPTLGDRVDITTEAERDALLDLDVESDIEQAIRQVGDMR